MHLVCLAMLEFGEPHRLVICVGSQRDITLASDAGGSDPEMSRKMIKLARSRAPHQEVAITHSVGYPKIPIPAKHSQHMTMSSWRVIDYQCQDCKASCMSTMGACTVG